MQHKTVTNILLNGDCVFNIAIICIHGEISQTIATFHQKYRRSHFSKCSTYLKSLVEQSDEIFGINTTSCGDSSWKHLSLIGDEEVISLSEQKSTYFEILHYALER